MTTPQVPPYNTAQAADYERQRGDVAQLIRCYLDSGYPIPYTSAEARRYALWYRKHRGLAVSLLALSEELIR